MSVYKAFLKTTFSTACCAALISCGGGGGSDDEPDTSGGGGGGGQEEVVVERVSLTGLAVKGKISGAQVNFYLVDSATGLLSDLAFANTTTRADGSYEMKSPEIEAYQGPVGVEILYKAGATIECDFASGCDVDNDGDIEVDTSSDVALGETYPLPIDFKMRAIAANVSSSNFGTQQFRVNITPLTEGAAALALSSNSLTTDEVNQSNNQIRALVQLPVDVSLINTSPEELNQDSDETDGAVEYALVISAFEGMSQDLNQSVDETLKQFVQQLTDNNGQLLFNNKDTEDADKVSLARLVEQAASAASTLGLATLSSQYNSQNTDYVAEPGGSFTEVAPPSVIFSGYPVDVNDQASVSISVTTNAPNVTYEWSQVEGAPVTLNNATTANLTFNAPLVEGPVVVRIIITDTVTDQTGVGFAKVNVKVPASTDPVNSVTGNYSMLIMGQAIDINKQFNASELIFASSYAPGMTVTGSALDDLSMNKVADSINIEQVQGWDNGNINSHSFEKYTETERFSLTSSVNANNNFQISVPASQIFDAEDSQWEVEPSHQTSLMPMGNGNYVGVLQQVFEQYGNNSGEPNFSDLNEVERLAEVLVLAKDVSHTASSIDGNYGMVSLTQRFEQPGQYLLASELSEHSLTALASGQSFAVDDSALQKAVDRNLIAAPGGVNIITGSLVAAHYDTTSSPVLNITPLDAHASFTSRIPGSFAYFVNANGDITAIEVSDVAETLGFRGIFANELIYSSTYAYQGNDPAAATWSEQRLSLGLRKPDVAISTTIANNSQYQVQGVVYKVRGCCQQIETEVLKNTLFSIGTSTVSISGLFESTRLNLADDTTSQFTNTETNAQMNFSVDTTGVVVIDGGDVKMEGFVSEDGSHMVLRFKGESSDVNDKYSEQGIFIASKIN